MNEKEYRLSVNARAPRGRRKRTASVGAGGSVYVTLGHTQSADSSGSQSGGSGGTSVATSPSVGGSDSGITEPAAKSAWVLTPSPTSVKIRPDSVIPRVSCTVEKLSGSSNKRLNTTDDLTAEGVALWVKIDDGEWQPYVIGTARNIIASALGLLTTQGGLRMVTQGDDIDPLTAEHLITFALRDAVDPDITYSAVNVPVVRDGEDGKDGKDGAHGPMVYPAGEWDATTEYTATAKACPVVLHNGQYYVLCSVGTCTGINPAEDYASKGDSAAWQLMERMNYVFADILMANFARLSSGVFYGDYLLSQQGIDSEGRATENYQDFEIGDDGRPTSAFTPNFCINFRTGEMSGMSGIFQGNLITRFVKATDSDAVTEKEGIYKVRSQHKLLAVGNGDVFVLPDEASYIGCRVMICDPRLKVRSNASPTVLQVNNSGVIMGVTNSDGTTSTTGVSRLDLYAGVVELLAVPKQDVWGNFTDAGCQWIVLTMSARYANTASTQIEISRPIEIIERPLLPGIGVEILDKTLEPLT